MSYLEELIGKPLDQVSDEELEECIIKGRLAREEEMTAAKKIKQPKTVALPIVKIPDFDLSDFDGD